MVTTRSRRGGMWKVFSFVLVVALVAGVVWLAIPGNMHRARDFFRDPAGALGVRSAGYYAKSLAAFDLSDGEMFVSKVPDATLPPASLAKLFVIEYASTIVKSDEIIDVSASALRQVKPGSSVANIKPDLYVAKDLYAAMLVPSGNDAAYALTDWVGAKIAPSARSVEAKREAFLSGLASHLKKRGYQHTVIKDPSGYDYQGSSTATEIKDVTVRLLKFDWFRMIVKQTDYTATLPHGGTQTWHNTNVYLDPHSPYYRPGVRGVKTGSLGDDYNLVVLYESKGKEFLVVSLGSETNEARYEDVAYVLNDIDDSYYLHNK